MRLLLPIFSLAGSVLASIPGSDKCTWGPTYWCTSITESQGCGATEFCLTKSWNQLLSSSNQNQLCDLCVSVMDKAIQQFKDNEDQLKETLENMCNYISMVDKCRDMVEENWEQIINLINDDLDSQVLCSAMNMCQQEDELVNEYQFVLATGFTGPLIMPNLPVVGEEEKEPTKDDTEHHIRFQPETETNEITQLKCRDPHCVKCDDKVGVHCYICEDGWTFDYSVYHCVKNKSDNQQATSDTASKQCNDCVQFGVDVKEIAESSKKLDVLVSTIQEICDELEMRSLCRLVLNKKVIKKIIDKVNIIDICHEVDICTVNDHPVLPTTKGNTCTDCHSMITDMQDLAKHQFDKFENVISHACDLAPKPINEMCKKMSQKFAEEAAESLKNADINQCCQDISLCDKDGNDPYAIKFESGHDQKDSKHQVSYPDYYFKQSKYCDYCEMAVEYIQYAVDSDMTNQQIKEGLKNVCNQLGENHLIQTCKEFIDKYWEKIVDDMDMILDDPEQVCISMHLCKAKNNVNEILGGSIAYPPECTYGPMYWCKSEENRIKCGIPKDYCQKNAGLLKAIENLSENVPIDCTKGPSYWCASEENMKKWVFVFSCQR